MSRFLNSAVSSVSGLFSRPTAQALVVSYGANREALVASIHKHHAIDLECGRRSRAARYQLGADVRALKEHIENEEGPGTWGKRRQELLPSLKERYLQKCVQFSETNGSEEEEDRIFGLRERSANLADQPETPPSPQTPLQVAQPEVVEHPVEQSNTLSNDRTAERQRRDPPAPPRGVRSDEPAQEGTQTPHGPVGRPLEEDRPLLTSWTHHDGDGTVGVDFPRLAEGEEIVGLLRAALAAAETAFPAPF